MNFKLFLTISLGLAFCASCSGRQGEEDISDENAYIVDSKDLTGADKDEHGCVHSAGYCWSEVQGRCIRLWEDGIKLSYLEGADSSSAEFAAYLVFGPDSLQVEFFMPQLDKPLLMNRKENGLQWFAGELKAGRVSEKWVVKRNDQIIGIQIPN